MLICSPVLGKVPFFLVEVVVVADEELVFGFVVVLDVVVPVPVVVPVVVLVVVVV